MAFAARGKRPTLGPGSLPGETTTGRCEEPAASTDDPGRREGTAVAALDVEPAPGASDEGVSIAQCSHSSADRKTHRKR